MRFAARRLEDELVSTSACMGSSKRTRSSTGSPEMDTRAIHFAQQPMREQLSAVAKAITCRVGHALSCVAHAWSPGMCTRGVPIKITHHQSGASDYCIHCHAPLSIQYVKSLPSFFGCRLTNPRRCIRCGLPGACIAWGSGRDGRHRPCLPQRG